MKMTLKEAKDCISPNHNCQECKFNKQDEFDCRGTAPEIGASAINYLMLGRSLANESEEKDR